MFCIFTFLLFQVTDITGGNTDPDTTVTQKCPSEECKKSVDHHLKTYNNLQCDGEVILSGLNVRFENEFAFFTEHNMINSVFRNVGMILQTDSSTNDLQIVKNSLQTQAYKQQAEQELVVNNNH